MTALNDAGIAAAPIQRGILRMLLSNPKVLAGIAILALFALLTITQPILDATLWAGQRHLYHPQFGFDSSIAHPSAPSLRHWLGTSSLGRDVFSMFIHATRPTFLVALSAGLSITFISVMLGSIAAFRRGWVDGFVSHLSDAMVLLPAMLAVFILGIGRPDEEFGALHVGLSFGVLYGLGPATATVRAAAMTVVARPFMDAARVAGGGGGWIVSRHMLPHLYPHAAVQAMIGATGAVIADAFLSFRSAVGEDFGFGHMVYDGIVWSSYLAGIADTPWWIMLAGAGGITLLAAAFYLLGVGLREALDPRTHRPRG
ncbi:MAG TPA: ABC transporter permease [Candidatus Limnocylindrales bacterium]|jgi:peptide/nickel transport system permease protein|nr:ABC transporter permease [Candidatus Limnocylindrales bacterium]